MAGFVLVVETVTQCMSFYNLSTHAVKEQQVSTLLLKLVKWFGAAVSINDGMLMNSGMLIY